MIPQKTQTLIYFPNGDVAKRIDDMLYEPISDILMIGGKTYVIKLKYDEIDYDGWIRRYITLKE